MKEYLEKVNYALPENKHKMNKLFEDVMCELKEKDKEAYDEAKMELYIIANGEKLTKECAEKWVTDMQPVGKHWTYEETSSVMQSKGYAFDPVDFFAIINNEYNDNYNKVKEDEELCVDLAYNFLKDTDAQPNKPFRYWYYIAKH